MSGMMTIGDTILGHYEVVDLVAIGGQATVAQGVDRRKGGRVAIKQLIVTPADSNYQQELERFQKAGSLCFGHPAVVDPIECREEDGQWYTVLPFIEGQTLDQFVTANGRLSVQRSSSIVLEVAHGLAAIHRKGIVHRDLKPANIQIDINGHPYILDLGISRNLNALGSCQDNRFMGTLPWVSPEQILCPGHEDHRSDLYSLGVIYYWLLTSDVPVEGDTTSDMGLSICQNTPRPPHLLDRSIPRCLSDACVQLLAKRPEDRLQTAELLIAAVTGAVEKAGAIEFCTSCGTYLRDKARFCYRCGADLAASATAVLCLACGSQIKQASSCPTCRRRFGRTEHRLAFKTGTLAGKTFRVPEGTYEIGRDVLCPRDQHISRKHLRVMCLNGSVLVEDLGSANRTYVGGLLADRVTPLADGLELCIAGNSGTYTSS